MSTKDTEVQQGASYPYVALSVAMTLAEAVKQCGGNKAPVQKSVLAHTLKEDEKSQGFTFKIAATKCYGIIEGRSAYMLTEEAKRYFYPTNEQDKAEAQLSFLAAPSGFSEIIKRFDGSKIPEITILANIFHRELRVPESWASRAASFFIRSAQHVGVVDEQGFLRFNAAKQGMVSSMREAEASPLSGVSETPALVSSKSLSELNPASGYHNYALPLPNDRKVIIQAPLDITSQEIKRLQKWIEFTLQVDWSGEN